MVWATAYRKLKGHVEVPDSKFQISDCLPDDQLSPLNLFVNLRTTMAKDFIVV